MIAMLLPCFAVCFFSIFEFVMRGHLFLFESVCVLPVVCVIVYGEMRQCFACFEVVDCIAMILLKGLLFVLDCLKWACVLIDVITTEVQFYNLLHAALFALQMTRQFANSHHNCNRVLFGLSRIRLS